MPIIPHQVRPFGPATRAQMRKGGQEGNPGQRNFRSQPQNYGDGMAGARSLGPPSQYEREVGDNESVDDANSFQGNYGPPLMAEQPTVIVQNGQLMKLVPADLGAPSGPAPPKEHPQDRMTKFWTNFEPEYEGGITQIMPTPLTTKTKADVNSNSTSHVVNTYEAYKQARDQCIKSVKRIVKECTDLNQKYTDVHFDIETDLKGGPDDCIIGLVHEEDYEVPQDVKRVSEIFKEPQFYRSGASYDDIIQGRLGDCWLLAGLSALTANEDLVQRICVCRDQEVGVYGFVFYRDGDWHPCIVDDKLYLSAPAFEETSEQLLGKWGISFKNEEKKYTKTFQTSSRALYFASCRDENETWVPLLEKAFAKAHGDYNSLEGGFTGEALEDLTGGTTNEIWTKDILSKDKFWKNNLSRNGKDYLFSCSIRTWGATLQSRMAGLEKSHAYAVLQTYEGHGRRLVKIRNPWGEQEWTGAWSDGSKEWNAEWLSRLDHKFGNDGVFWMSYEDMLKRYSRIDRTRIFGKEWFVAQQWTKVQVPWSTRDYQQTKFSIEVPEETETVIVLSQLDDRYFRGLQGKFSFTLQFRVQKDGGDDDDYIVRTPVRHSHTRSTNVEVTLEKGTYTVLFKVEAYNQDWLEDVEDVIRKNVDRRDKISRMATLYDLAHAKGEFAQKRKPEMTEGAKADDEKATIEKKEDSDEKKDSEPTEKKIEEKTEDKKAEVIGKEEDEKKEATDKQDEKKEETDKKEESKSEVPEKQPTVEQPQPQPQPEPKPEQKEPETPPKPVPDDSDPNRTPWNAFCTVGLRVYSKTPKLGLTVVLPWEERPAVLDRDDIAKAALDEHEVAVQKSVSDSDNSDSSSSSSSDAD